MKRTPLRSFVFSILLFSAATVNAQHTYEHGHGAMQLFDAQGMANAPLWVQIWIYFMLASFITSLLFVKRHVEARWVAACFLTGAGLMLIISRGIGIPMLSGFIASMHLIAWTPALIVLLKRHPFTGPISAFSIWSGVITFVILFSFVFDIRDAAIFLTHYF